ncbi:phage tail assembly chaperone family protein, TAC [Salinicola aestuarinus]|uniref:phage tail assembly chaperone family protein, TAC n=1 Tax=Salinicola aestuarinus TaxID=1949082 RepID=UPI000DA249E0|nr:phage tail assembly chaperone family protein, TAC [Salinicola aestuarinus]
MQLSIDNLKTAGAFTGVPVEKTIEWQQGGETLSATTYVRPMSYHSAVSDITAVRGGGDIVASRIAACICDAEGKAVFSVADITGEADPERGALDGALTMELLRVIGEVTGLGKSSASSTEKTSSSTSSSSTASAGARSKKRGSASATRKSGSGRRTATSTAGSTPASE